MHSIRIQAQTQVSQWYFGKYAAINFLTNPPTALNNNSGLYTYEGSSSIADENGNLLFYTDGVTVWNASHQVMPNGTGLFGQISTTQSALIVKQPGNDSLYYVFTQDLTTLGKGLCYSVVNMNLAGGTGSVVIKNVLLSAPGTERLTGAKHCNGRDVWIVSHDWQSDNFRSYLLTASGVNTNAVLSPVGSVHTYVTDGFGALKISPQGNKLAVAILGAGSVELFDFNNQSGVVSNSLIIGSGLGFPYGCEFSSDGSKLYVSTEYPTALIQFNLCAGNSQAIVASQTNIPGAGAIYQLQLGADRKIYVARNQKSALGVINNPELTGSLCNYVDSGFSIFPDTCILGLPGFVNDYFLPEHQSFTYTIEPQVSCQTASFSAPASNSMQTSCAQNNSITSFEWDFGDPASGPANVANTANPVHVYSSAGFYTVSLILHYGCTSYSFKKILNITGTTPVLQIAGTFTTCQGGPPLVLTASGALSYSWSTGATTSSIAVTPSVTTNYFLTAYNNDLNCRGSKLVLVSVLKCLDLTETEAKKIRVYPVPANDVISIDNNLELNVLIKDVYGRVMGEATIQPGISHLDLLHYAPGIYFLHFSNGLSKQVQKMQIMR